MDNRKRLIATALLVFFTLTGFHSSELNLMIEYTAKVTQELGKVAGIDNAQLIVLDDEVVLQGYTMCGGDVNLTKALLRSYADEPDLIAGIVAHELAHTVNRDCYPGLMPILAREQRADRDAKDILIRSGRSSCDMARSLLKLRKIIGFDFQDEDHGTLIDRAKDVACDATEENMLK